MITFKFECTDALWFRWLKNQDVSTGPLARSFALPFARLLAPLTHSLALDCSLRSRPPLHSLVRSLAHFAHSLARGTVNDWMAILSVFFFLFSTIVQGEKIGLIQASGTEKVLVGGRIDWQWMRREGRTMKADRRWKKCIRKRAGKWCHTNEE